MIVLCILLALGGFTGLFLGMPRHQRDVLGRALPSAWSLRWKVLGWTGLSLSFLLAAYRDGAALGAVYWLGELTFTSLCVGLCATGLASRRP